MKRFSKSVVIAMLITIVSQASFAIDANYSEKLKSKGDETLVATYLKESTILLTSCTVSTAVTGVVGILDTLPLSSFIVNGIDDMFFNTTQTQVPEDYSGTGLELQGDPLDMKMLGGLFGGALITVVNASVGIVESAVSAGVQASRFVRYKSVSWTKYEYTIDAAKALLSNGAYNSTKDVAQALFGKQSHCVDSWLKLAAIKDEFGRRMK